MMKRLQRFVSFLNDNKGHYGATTLNLGGQSSYAKFSSYGHSQINGLVLLI